MNRAFKRIFSVSLILLCLAIAHQSQTKLPDNKTGQQTSSLPKQDLSTWQTVSLSGKGIKFKLPPDWRYDDVDLSKRSAGFVIEEVQWSPPDKDTPNKESISIFLTTYRAGFVSNERTASSKEEMVQQKFDLVTRSAQSKDSSSSYTEVKKLSVSGVEGVFRVMSVSFEDKDIGSREGLYMDRVSDLSRQRHKRSKSP